MAIGHNPGCTQSDIARLHRSQAANLVPLVAKLERDGLLDRAPGRGRAIALSVSGKGAGLLAEVEADFAKLENHLGAALAPVERAQAIAVLRGLCDAACHFRRD
jgi:DNA-binding MarR family transcriptional regulator